MSAKGPTDAELRMRLGLLLDEIMKLKGTNPERIYLEMKKSAKQSTTAPTIRSGTKGKISVKSYKIIFEHLCCLKEYENEIKSQKNESAIESFSRSIDSIGRFILDQSDIAAPKTELFVGRKQVFRKIDEFLGRHASGPGGYFILKGDPGIGKSAIVANLPFRSSEYAHLPMEYFKHYNSRSSGPRSTREFLGNICGRIIRRFGLPYDDIPTDGADGAAFLRRVLTEAVRAQRGYGLIVVVDALDETDDVSGGVALEEGRNILGLPMSLPNGVNFVLTSRREEYLLKCDGPKGELELDPKGRENEGDLLEYIELVMAQNPGVAAFATGCGLDAPTFAERMLEKSEGNFLFLHHVFSDMRDAASRPGEFLLDEIPQGIVSYYEQHWHRIKCKDLTTWADLRLPVIAAFCAEEGRPMTIEHLVDLTGISVRILPAVLTEWQQFIRSSKKPVDGKDVVEFAIYHTRFLEFLEERPEIRYSGLVDELRDRFRDAIFDDIDGER